MERIDAVVIGAGVIGLAAARALALAGREVIVVERTETIGSGTSSRNSEVIHGGLYYATGSLKARACVEGRRRLYGYLDRAKVAHRRCGKLVVATAAAQVPALDALADRARANGVEGLRRLDGEAARALESALACVAALESPETGILDSHGFMLALQGDAEAAGAVVAFGAPVEAGRAGPDGLVLEIGGSEPTTLAAGLVVNAAGLHAPAVARRIVGLPPETVPVPHWAKGTYFGLAGRSPFGRLIYPMPDAAGLGVHLTLDLGGQARFGPDVEWLDDGAGPDAPGAYDVDPARAESFYAAIRTYWPDLPDGALVPGYAGIRPKLQAPGEPARDFLVQGPAEHGVPGLVHLYGIESPGLTGALALADVALDRLGLAGAPPLAEAV